MLKLTKIGDDRIPVEANAIAPDCLMGKTAAEVASLKIQHGNRDVQIGDLFRVASEGGPSDGKIEIEGDCSSIKGLGRRMASGHLVIRGNVGMHAGAEMSGGRIDIFGDCADWLGAEMRGGQIHVHGNAANLVGAAYRGGTKGMRGGSILIDGDAGDEVGASMRRGLIAVGGRCGGMAGISMIAGTVIACRGIGPRPGAGMKRGSLIVLDGVNGPFEPPPTFRRTADYDPAFLHLYLNHLRGVGFALPPIAPGHVFRRYSGDLISLGKGEILVACG